MHPTLANRFEYRLQYALTSERNNHIVLRQLAELDATHLAFLNPVVVLHSVLGISSERAGGERVRVDENPNSAREFDTLRWQIVLRLIAPRRSHSTSEFSVVTEDTVRMPAMIDNLGWPWSERLATTMVCCGPIDTAREAFLALERRGYRTFLVEAGRMSGDRSDSIPDDVIGGPY